MDALEVLLQGLCGGLRETIKVHEICLKTGPNLGANQRVHLLCNFGFSDMGMKAYKNNAGPE